VTAIVAEGGMLLFGDELGRITLTGRDIQTQSSPDDRVDSKQVFRGPVYGLSYIFDPKNHNKQYIIAIGDDNPSAANRRTATASGEEKSDPSGGNPSQGNSAVIKVFNASDLSRPMQSFAAGYTGLSASAKVASFAVLSDGSQIVVGFSNGAITLFVGNFFKDLPQNR
jgi:hypothetical protein